MKINDTYKSVFISNKKHIIAKTMCLFVIIYIGLPAELAVSQDKSIIREMDRRAHEYYDKKELSKAIVEWLKILEIDPNNEEIQRKIELVYDEKHKKDISLQRAKLFFRLSRRTLYTDIEKAKNNAKIAIDNFIIAYRLDPRNPELQILRESFEQLDSDIKLELAKKRLSEEIKQRYYALLNTAQNLMNEKKHEESIPVWDEILRLVPLDVTASEGKRQAQLAVTNRLRFEKILLLISTGQQFFTQEKYIDSRNEFLQVIKLDAKNRTAADYLNRIDDILEDKRTFEQRRIQAEQFYITGVNNIKIFNFAQAKDDLENALALVENYKDAKTLLESIPLLQNQYEERRRILALQQIDKTFQEGLIALTEARYRDSVTAFQATLTLDPDNKLAKRYLSTALDALKVEEEQIIDENNPYFFIVQPLIESGKRLFNQGNYNDSRRQWEKILNLFPKNIIATEYMLRCDLIQNPESFKRLADNFVTEGKNLLAEKKFSEAYRKFELIASIDPRYPEIQNLLVQSRQERKQIGFAGTDEDFRRRYNNAMQLYQRGGKNNLEKALTDFRTLNNNYPDNIQVAIIVNKIESQLRFAVTVDRQEQALTPRQRELVREFYFKGIDFYAKNQFESAIAEWRKVLAIDPNHEKARNNIKKCLILLGR